MAIKFDDIDDLLEFANDYTGLGRSVTDQLEELRGGERLPSDALSQDAVQHYIVPFLTAAWLDRGISFPELSPNEDAAPGEEFYYLFAPELDSFTVTVTIKVMAEDEFDTISIDNRVRNALETEGLNIYTDLTVEKL